MTDLNLDEVDFTQNIKEPGNEQIEVLDINTHNDINLEHKEFKDRETISSSSTKATERTFIEESRVTQIKSDDVIKPDIFVPGDSLKEPIKETFLRDITRMYRKAKYFLKLKGDDNSKDINDWELWGPFILCLLLSS